MYLTDERKEYNESKFPSPLPASEFSKSELLAAEKWRNAYLKYMRSIEDSGMPDADCDAAKATYDRGIEILEAQDLSRTYKTEAGNRREDYKKRKRVLHAVNALCVYGEPDELGHQEYTLAAAKVGLAALAAKNF